MSKQAQTIHIIAGPTASGKSSKALELAGEVNGVIINADSVQIYDGLPILTAQPSEKDKDAALHRLYGALHPNEVCSAGNWREMAEPLIEEVLEEGRTPIIVGGSGLYIKALTEGLSPIPGIPEDIRTASVQKQQELGNPAFHAALEKRDPAMAKRLHPHNTARLIRAWEVLEATGRSLADWQKETRLHPPAHWRFEIDVILPERQILRERCDARFESMLGEGALEEVENFSQKIEEGHVRTGVPLTKALGFQALCSYVKGGLSKAQAIEKAQAETRQYAKKQVTWFRHQI